MIKFFVVVNNVIAIIYVGKKSLTSIMHYYEPVEMFINIIRLIRYTFENIYSVITTYIWNKWKDLSVILNYEVFFKFIIYLTCLFVYTKLNKMLSTKRLPFPYYRKSSMLLCKPILIKKTNSTSFKSFQKYI